MEVERRVYSGDNTISEHTHAADASRHVHILYHVLTYVVR